MKRAHFGRRGKMRSFSFSLFAFYSAGLLATIVIVTSFFSAYTNRLSAEVTSSYNAAVIGRLTDEVDGYLQEAVDMSSYPYIYKEWQELMKRPPAPPLDDLDFINLVNMQQFDNSLLQMASSVVDYRGVYLFCENGLLLYNASNLPDSYILACHQDQAYKDTPWYARALAADGSVIVLRQDQVETGADDDGVFYIIRLVKDIASGKEIGVYMMEVDKQYLTSLCRNYTDSKDERCIIFDPDGTAIISSDDEPAPPNSFLEELAPDRTETIYTADGTEYLVTYSCSQVFGWTIAKSTPLSISKQARRVALITLVLFIACCLAFAIAVFFVLSKQLAKPIKQLIAGMKEVETGNYAVHLQPETNNELSELFTSFNSMTAQIQYLVEKVLAEEVQKKEAQIVALQRQINPHFLYNTLDSIQIVAITNGNYLVSRMITSLAKIYRYAASDSERVTLGDELSYIDEYISLQKIRFKDGFSLIKDIPETFADKPIIRLSLQPIIENSIQHGLRGLPNRRIAIRAHTVENGYEIVIEDNGKGMSDEQIASIGQRLSEADTGHESIGIYNVNSRLRAVFGKGSGLLFDHAAGGGTAVTVRVIYEGRRQ